MKMTSAERAAAIQLDCFVASPGEAPRHDILETRPRGRGRLNSLDSWGWWVVRTGDIINLTQATPLTGGFRLRVTNTP